MDLTRKRIGWQVTGSRHFRIEGQFFQSASRPDSNKVILGENQDVMLLLLGEYCEKFDFIYFDPPFNTGRIFTKAIDLRCEPVIRISAGKPEFEDLWEDSAYCYFVLERLRLARLLLAPTGSIIIHCDFNAQHLIRSLAERVFSGSAFRNQIIWKYSQGIPQPNIYAASHDILFWYTRSDRWTFQLSTLEVSGERVAATHDGLADVWDDPSIQKNWLDIDKLDTDADGDAYLYPTQKPLSFLTRLLLRHTRPGDLLLDVFSGSGSLAVAALTCQRRFVAIDVNPRSAHVTTQRILRRMVRDRNGFGPGLELLSLDHPDANDRCEFDTRPDTEPFADFDIEVRDGMLSIRRFRSQALFERLNLELGPAVAGTVEWRSLVDGVMIDWAGQSEIFRPTVLDLPPDGARVRGEYQIDNGARTARVRICDVSGGRWEQRVELTG